MTTLQNSPYADLRAEEEHEIRPRCAEPDIDPELFDPRTQYDFDDAVKVCGSCPKRIDCRREGVQGKETGVWGGAYLDQGRQRRPTFRKIGVRRSSPAPINKIAQPIAAPAVETVKSSIPTIAANHPRGILYSQEEFDILMGRVSA